MTAAPPSPPTPPADPVPAAARTALDRIAQRWRVLPLASAEEAAPCLRELAERFAAEVAGGEVGGEVGGLPDLGPACALDQLTVLTYDVCRVRTGASREAVAAELDDLRRALP